MILIYLFSPSYSFAAAFNPYSKEEAISPNLRCSQTDPVYLSIMKITFVFLIHCILIIVHENQVIFIYNFEAYDVYHRKPQITLFLKIFFLPNDCL